jgi:hypothetical protein
MKTELEILIDAVALRASTSRHIVQNIFEHIDAAGWQVKPKRAPELPNIPLDACGGKDIGFTAHVLGGR